MFMLTRLEDSVRVDPRQMGMPTAIALEEQIKILYFDKIINNVGLVVSLYDLVSIDGGDVHNGDGGVRFSVQFNLVMFRPFEGEVMLGRILKSNECVIPNHRCQVSLRHPLSCLCGACQADAGHQQWKCIHGACAGTASQ